VIGRTLSSYRVVEKLGEGGMGEVYLARDERLGRDVALKILPEGRLADEVARGRFRKEAQALLRLSHPHVATLLDFGSTDGTDYLVMERVSGPTLDVVLRKGPLPEKEVVRLGTQLARGLAAAHEAGVVHRDLKPSNLALTPDGLLKVLDFGLARVEQGADGQEATKTAPGFFAGTPAYMAPEQVRGDRADVRTDVYGAGAVLYELVTARRVFEGKKGADLTSAILQQAPPPPRTRGAAVSAGLEAVILKSLDKDPDLRYQSARELLVDLERLARGATAPTADISAPAAGARWSRLLPWLVAAVALVSAALCQLLPARVPRITQVTRIVGGLGRAPDSGWATDGVRLYYVGAKGGGLALFQVPAAGGEPSEIPLPFDDVRVHGYVARESALLMGGSKSQEISQQMEGFPLWIVPVPTGAPRRLGGLVGMSAAVSPDGERIAVCQMNHLIVARADGSDARPLAMASAVPMRGTERWVRWSPDGKSLRIQGASSRGFEPWIWEVPLDGEAARPLWPGHLGSRTGDGRYFVFQRQDHGGDIYAVREERPWPWSRIEPVRLTFGPLSFETPGSSLDGRRLFAWGTIERQVLLRHDPRARRFVPYMGGAPAGHVSASHDGRWLAWVRLSDRTLWRSRADGAERLQLTAPPLVAQSPRWSPDDRRIVFVATLPGERSDLRIVSSDGGEVELLAAWPKDLAAGQEGNTWDPCWADGRTVVFSSHSAFQPGLFRVDVRARQVSRLPGTEDLQFPKCGPQGQVLAVIRPKSQAGPVPSYRVLWPGRESWEDAGPMPGGAWANWSRDGESIIGLNEAAQRIERRSLRTGRGEVLADVHDLRLGTVGGTTWMGLGPDDALLVVEDLSTSDLYALDWYAP
jgi:hypothetical protein